MIPGQDLSWGMVKNCYRSLLLYSGIKLFSSCGFNTDHAFKLKELTEEIPELNVSYDEEVKEINIELMGQVQIEVIKHLIEERTGINVSFGTGKILYKETICNSVEGVGHFEPLRHYAEVHLLLEPLERGMGLVFETDCSEEILAKNWQRLVLTHLEEKIHRGVLTGAPVTDMK